MISLESYVMDVAPLECSHSVSSRSRHRIMHHSFDFVHLHHRDHMHQPRNSAQTETAAKVLGDVRDRVTKLRTASLRQQHNHFPHSVIPQPRRILLSSYLSISSEPLITKHQRPQNQLSEPLRNSASPPNLLALRHHHKQLPTWRSSSLVARTLSRLSSKVTRTSQRSAKTAATSAHESTSAGSGSRSASFLVRTLCAFAQNKQPNHRTLTLSPSHSLQPQA